MEMRWPRLERASVGLQRHSPLSMEVLFGLHPTDAGTQKFCWCVREEHLNFQEVFFQFSPSRISLPEGPQQHWFQPFLPPATLFLETKRRTGTSPGSPEPPASPPSRDQWSCPCVGLRFSLALGKRSPTPNVFRHQPHQSLAGGSSGNPGRADTSILPRVPEQVAVCPSQHLAQRQHQHVRRYFPCHPPRSNSPGITQTGLARGGSHQREAGHVLPQPHAAWPWRWKTAFPGGR